MTDCPSRRAESRRAGRLPALAALVALLVACSPAPTESSYERTIYVFGTLVTLTLWGVEPHRAETIGDQVERELQRMHDTWHAWKPSEVTELNRAIARGEPFRVTPDVADLIRLSKQTYRSSDHLFDAADGHLFALWGFEQDEPPTGPPPTPEQVAAIVEEHASMDDVDLEGDVVRSRNPEVALDFGGIAKGCAGQVILAKLKREGVRNAILNAGGGLQVMGQHGERRWRVGIRAPQGSGVVAVVELGPQEEAVHTSGNYERYREYHGKRYQHIIDPRTGLPAEHIVSATVIDANGAIADAAATALVVAGPKDWQRIAERMGIDQAILIDDQGTVYMTPKMEKRVAFEQRPKKLVISGG
jgi:thiamine biosynthesis lipoprotein